MTASARAIVYVDGFNLYHGIRAAYARRFYWLDLVALSRLLLEPSQHLVKVHYFTARIREQPGVCDAADVKRQTDYLEALATRAELERHEGHFLKKERTCRSCHHRSTTFEEKMSDVNLAVQLVTDAMDSAFDTAIVVSGDSDLVTPIRVVRERFPERNVVVAFPPRRQSEDLKRAVSRQIVHIGEDKLRKSLLPDTVTTTNGHVLRRPESWK